MELLVLVVIVVLVIAYVDAPKKKQNKLPVTTYSRTLRKK